MNSIKPEQRLQQLRLELLAALEEGDAAAQPVGLDQNKVGRLSRMDAMQQQSMQRASQSAIRKRLVEIAKASLALENGDYGYCDRCGEEIPKKRLEVKPEALLCIRCQEEIERAN